jgi:hypothetical protein
VKGPRKPGCGRDFAVVKAHTPQLRHNWYFVRIFNQIDLYLQRSMIRREGTP